VVGGSFRVLPTLRKPGLAIGVVLRLVAPGLAGVLKCFLRLRIRGCDPRGDRSCVTSVTSPVHTLRRALRSSP
jgi:hypothetical protein